MSAWPKLKNKKGALQKILWAELSVLLQKRAKWACIERRKPIFRSSFHFELIHFPQNKDHEKAI